MSRRLRSLKVVRSVSVCRTWMPQTPRDELNVDELHPVDPFRRSPDGDQGHLVSVIERARQASSHAYILNRRLLEADELLTKMPPAKSTPSTERPLRIAVVSGTVRRCDRLAPSAVPSVHFA